MNTKEINQPELQKLKQAKALIQEVQKVLEEEYNKIPEEETLIISEFGEDLTKAENLNDALEDLDDILWKLVTTDGTGEKI
jgi:transcriptional/translational regulatory protein YebC/TACO1